jgi:hypothetical protein
MLIYFEYFRAGIQVRYFTINKIIPPAKMTSQCMNLNQIVDFPPQQMGKKLSNTTVIWVVVSPTNRKVGLNCT